MFSEWSNGSSADISPTDFRSEIWQVRKSARIRAFELPHLIV